MEFPIEAALSAAGDTGQPLVVSDPTGETAKQYGELGAVAVREIAKLERAPKNVVRYDEEFHAFAVQLPNMGGEHLLIAPLESAWCASHGSFACC